jgi:competence protein ComEC
MKSWLDPGWRWGLAGLAWLAGVWWQVQQAQLWPAAASGATALLAGAASGVLLTRRSGRAFALGIAALALAAFASTDWRAAERLAQSLAAALEGRDLVVTGVIAELPRRSPIGTRFTLEVDSATLDGEPVRVPPRLALGWYEDRDVDKLTAGSVPAIAVGDRWRMPVRLKQPHGTMNPFGFDLELYLFEQEIGAGGSVRPGAALLASRVAHPVERLRQTIRDAIVLRVPDSSAAGVLAALAVGDQAAIDREGWDIFRITGVAHLMSISGLHVTMFAWLAGLCVGWAWRRSSRLMLWAPAPVVARWGGLLSALLYAVLAGWGVPAQRTVLMIGMVVLLRTLGLRWPQSLVLLAAGVAVTMLDPWAVLQPGFWLSFFAVAVLIASDSVAGGARRQPGWRGTLRAALHTQAVATVGLAPLSMVFFQQVSVVGFVANLVAIPLVTLVITPLALVGMLLPPLWLLAAWCVQALQWLLGAMAAWSLANWSAAAAPLWGVTAGLVGGALLVMPLPWRLRLLGLPMMLPLFWPPVAVPPAGRFEAVMVDIGQGTAVLVRTRHHLMVYDAGPQYSPESDAGGRVLLPLLRSRGERNVDLLVLSHRDTDHTGGATSLLAGVEVLASASSLAPDHPLLARLPQHRRCDAGQQWRWDGVDFKVLHPQAEDHARALKSNALSCVIQVEDRSGMRLLLTGDIEAAQEAALVERLGPALASQVLLVPHHGSKTSSTLPFLAAVSPQRAVVQAAYRSRFGHPAPDVVRRYRAQGIEVVRNDECGAYTWSSGSSGSTAPAAGGPGVCQRQAGRRYWHHRAHPSGNDQTSPTR